MREMECSGKDKTWMDRKEEYLHEWMGTSKFSSCSRISGCKQTNLKVCTRDQDRAWYPKSDSLSTLTTLEQLEARRTTRLTSSVSTCIERLDMPLECREHGALK